MKKLITSLFFFALLVCFSTINAQNIPYAKKVIKTMASPEFHGRGYVKKGDKIAAEYIAAEYKKLGLQCFDKDYFQEFSVSVNTFPGKMKVKIGDAELKPGVDYMVNAFSPSERGTYKLVFIDNNKSFADILLEYRNVDLRDSYIVYSNNKYQFEGRDVLGAAGYIRLQSKLYWRYADGYFEAEVPHIIMQDSVLDKDSKEISIRIQNRFEPSYKTNNVIGYIEGKKYKDKFIAFTGHYDHLGHMGKDVIFPGANDNASGIAMMLNLAEYFSREENQPDYSIIFLSFAAEESGLHGSKYYTEFPFFPLNNIESLINLDMVGSGSNGITLVNGADEPELLEAFKDINDKNDYLKQVVGRPSAPNSDHYFFSEKGVPSVFIYTMGREYLEYHTVTDQAKDVPLTEFADLFKLLRDFVEESK